MKMAQSKKKSKINIYTYLLIWWSSDWDYPVTADPVTADDLVNADDPVTENRMDRSNFVGSLDPFLSGSGSGDKMNINQVPKSHSSSSGVNDISDSVSSTNSKEDLSSRNKKDSDVPTFGDVLDLLKFSYILQVWNM